MGDWLDILPSWQSCNDLPELGRTVKPRLKMVVVIGGDLFLVGSLKKVGGNDMLMFKVGCRLGFPHPVLSLKKLTEC